MGTHENPATFTTKQFDYLIVGGGTAGLVVAARLSEKEHLNIGVLEAGHAIPDDTPAVSVPGRWGDGIGTEYDWQFETTPQKQLGGRRLAWPRGKALGGSAALNFMIWNRPSRDDLDAWERMGCKGWGWDEMLHCYKKSENFIEPDAQSKMHYKVHYNRDAHGTDGPLTVSFNKEHSAPHRFWHDTLENLGITTNEAHMSGSNVGAWTSMVAVDPKSVTREYSATSYYKPAKDRKNLSVLTGATVQHVILNQVNDEWVAKGVQFEHEGSSYVAHASREVILSAGSVKSPQLLELSGIGNPSILEEAGIETKVVNKNVGENLQDHLLTATIYEIDPAVSTLDDLKVDHKLAAAADEQYRLHLTGPRTLLSCSMAYIPLPTVASTEDIAHLASHAPAPTTPRAQSLATRLTSSSNGGHVEYIFDVGNWNPFTPVTEGKKYATLLQILQYPFSCGSIHIDPTVPTGPPIIDPRYYEDESGRIDMAIQLRAAAFGQKILETEPLKSFVKDRVWPPPNLSEGEWMEWIVGNTTTDWHPVGTCGMGGAEGKEAGVVDERLRVYGVKGLRVVDASVMPIQISAHLQATVYAIGEKGAEMILEDAERG